MPTATTTAVIGAMREPVTIQYAQTTADGMGGTTVTWPQALHRQVWARVLPLTLTERERLASLQITAMQSYRLTLRYRTDLTVKERILWRAKQLQIHTVTDDASAKRRTVLECTEVQ